MRQKETFYRSIDISALRRGLASVALIASVLITAVGLSACDPDNGSSAPGGTPVSRSGDAIFARYCATCHPGGGRGVGPSLITSNYTVEELRATVRHGKAQMPGFGSSTISDTDLDALVAYIQGMRH